MHCSDSLIPSSNAGHFILQMEERGGGLRWKAPPLQHSRRTSGRPLQPPVFRLAGLAIGDGLTDPLTQVRRLENVADSKALLQLLRMCAANGHSEGVEVQQRVEVRPCPQRHLQVLWWSIE